MDKQIALITWTHNEYSDIWPMYFGRLDKHVDYSSSYVFVDKFSNKINKKHIQLINNDKSPWHKRFLHCLRQVKEDYVLYMQEDHIMYSDCDHKKLNEIFDLFKNSDFSCIRLIKSGEQGGDLISDNLFKIPKNSRYLFSQQSAIWKKEDLQEILSFYRPMTFRDVEAYGSFAMSNLNKSACYYYNDEPKRGSLHCDSSIFPYISTAVCKAKWNLKEYPVLLQQALDEYHVDCSLRGLYGT